MKGNLWGADAPSEDCPIELVVYRSRLIASDPDLVVWGGGNTSVKTREADHLGRMCDVLRIKGSGTDLKSVDRSSFPGIFRDDVLPLLDREEMSDEAMVAYLEHCMVEPGGRRPSIETLLHAFLPARHVDHVHADSIVALTNTARGLEVTREALGNGVAIVPYRRPGFRLAKQVHDAARGHDAVVLANHGLVTWGDTAEVSYRKTIELAERAQHYLEARVGGRSHHVAPQSPPREARDLLLRLRGQLGHVILYTDSSPEPRAIADRPDAVELAAAGPATADHVLRIRPWACVIDGEPGAAIEAYKRRYRSFFEHHASPDLTMLDPRPRVFLVPGLGMVAVGKDVKDARVTAEVALHTLRVAALGKDAHGTYRSLDEQDLFDVDYWPLELYKLTLAPPPRELAGRIAIVTGAASGIGRAVARHLACLGAQTALLDLNADGLERTAQLVAESGGAEPLTVPTDVTEAGAVAGAVRQVIETFGGVDALVSNAGIAATGRLTELDANLWRRSLEVNATSHFLATAEVMRAMETQGLGGSLVYVASKNAFGPGAGFGAYSAAKAAEVQLARIAALEGGPVRIRANAVNPDAVFEDSGLWSDTVRRERAAAHGVAVEDLDSSTRSAPC
ncbi:MAG TPA: bifunctional aldolase/short-chain dehydrogenase [Chloroflexota bacterium]|nr:bifunctional aldolase/short-chain dehydrogenase [Chloroflexota bacterium]